MEIKSFTYFLSVKNILRKWILGYKLSYISLKHGSLIPFFFNQCLVIYLRLKYTMVICTCSSRTIPKANAQTREDPALGCGHGSEILQGCKRMVYSKQPSDKWNQNTESYSRHIESWPDGKGRIEVKLLGFKIDQKLTWWGRAHVQELGKRLSRAGFLLRKLKKKSCDRKYLVTA